MTKLTMLFVCAAALCLSAVLGAREEEQYDSKYDNFDIESVLSNDRILKNYMKCFTDSGPCTPEGKEFRQTLPEVLETSCGKCTVQQRKLIRRLVKFIKTNKPDDWEVLVKKFDPQGKYKASFEKFEEGTD